MYAIDCSLWIIASVLCALALLIGWRRRRVNTLPVFFGYLGYSALTNPVAFAIRSSRIYEWVMFSVAFAGFALELAVIYELANKVVLSHSPLAKIFQAVPRWSTAALLLLVTIIAALLPQHARTLAMQAYSTLSFSLNLMDIALLLTIFMVTRLMGVSWGILPAGAALGVGITDAGCAAGAVLLAQLGIRYVVDFVRLGSFDVAGLVWVFSVFKTAGAAGTGSVLQISELGIHSREAEEVGLALDLDAEPPN